MTPYVFWQTINGRLVTGHFKELKNLRNLVSCDAAEGVELIPFLVRHFCSPVLRGLFRQDN
jgi:hypothetical protein